MSEEMKKEAIEVEAATAETETEEKVEKKGILSKAKGVIGKHGKKIGKAALIAGAGLFIYGLGKKAARNEYEEDVEEAELVEVSEPSDEVSENNE